MKNIFKILFLISIVFLVYIYKDNISNYITDEIIYKGSNKVLTYNEYYINNNFKYVQNIDTNSTKNKQEVLNMIYTIINSGDESFSFNCDYDDCINDVKNIISDNTIFSNINNFVHPYNSFNSINIDITDDGRITITTKKLYKEEEIDYIDSYIDNFILNNLNDGMSNLDKIKLFHDYIINNTIYDEGSNESHSAYTLITTGKSICGGYSDILSIFLHRLNLTNYKITSKNHVWNLVNIDGVWYHIDMTWDDPVASDGNQYLLHNFFMISKDELYKLDTVEHTFDENIFIEAK